MIFGHRTEIMKQHIVGKSGLQAGGMVLLFGVTHLGPLR